MSLPIKLLTDHVKNLSKNNLLILLVYSQKKKVVAQSPNSCSNGLNRIACLTSHPVRDATFPMTEDNWQKKDFGL
jgi:hypothetical protein